MNLSARIAEMETALKAAGVSAEKLITSADVGRSTWHRWKRGGGAHLHLWQRVEDAFAALVGE